jgi:hypothetical protein
MPLNTVQGEGIVLGHVSADIFYATERSADGGIMRLLISMNEDGQEKKEVS